METTGKTVTKIYLVCCEAWEDEGHKEWVVKACGNPTKAYELRDRLNEWFKQWYKNFLDLPDYASRLKEIEDGSDLDPNFSDNWDHYQKFTEYFVVEVDYDEL